MAFNLTDGVTKGNVKTEFEEICEGDRDIDLTHNISNSMDWKLNPNVECRVTLEKLRFPPPGNDIQNSRATEMNVRSVHTSDTDTYSKFRLLVDELSNFVDKCEKKCSDCEEYILQLQNHVIQTHARSNVNRSHDRDNPSNSSNNSNHRNGIYKYRPLPLNKIPNNEEEEGRMSETPSGNQDFGSIGSLINPELITLELEHVNHFSTIAQNPKQEPYSNSCHEDPLLDMEVSSDIHLERDPQFSENVVTSCEDQLTGETELTGTHSINLIGNTASTSFTPSGTKLKSFKCPTCGKYIYFTKRAHLIRHIKMHNTEVSGESGESGHKCDVCGKYYTTPSNLIIHQRTQHTVSPFKCSVCGKCFDRKTGLIRHKCTRTGVLIQVFQV